MKYEVVINEIILIAELPKAPSKEQIEALCWEQGYAGQYRPSSEVEP